MAKKPITDKPQTATGQADKKPTPRRTRKERAKTGTPEFHKRVKEELAAQGLQHAQDRKPRKEFTYTREVFGCTETRPWLTNMHMRRLFRPTLTRTS